ncbi:MAG: methyltransferase domain-containing protein, partial [Planctomycetota bacterium]
MSEVTNCRGCDGASFETILDYGDMPLADRLVDPGRPGPEARVPLVLVRCTACSLVQITHRVSAEELFDPAFPYHSRFSASLVASFRAHAAALIEAHSLGSDDLVVDLGSNDGSLLAPFAERGVRVLGIDPAPGPSEHARSIGIETLGEFFSETLAHRLASQGDRARVVLAKNVLAHVADQRSFLRGVRALLTDDGVAVFEFPSVVEMVRRGIIDTVYHEHQCCFSVTALAPMLLDAGLAITHVEMV